MRVILRPASVTRWLVLTFLIVSGIAQATPAYIRYRNERFGFTVSYPEYFKKDAAPGNGDGIFLDDGHGCTINAFAGNNALGESLEDEAKRLAEQFDRITYRAKGEAWRVLSGFKKGEIIYIKAYVGIGARNQLRIRCPNTRTQRMSEITKKVSGSFQPGDLREAH